MKEFFTGISHFFKATGFLAGKRLLHFYLFPLLLSILFYMFVIALIYGFASEFAELLFGKYIPHSSDSSESTKGFMDFLRHLPLESILSALMGLLVFLISAKFSKYIILILLSPVFSILSEKVEEKLSGRIYPFSPLQFIKDISRGILIALRNFIIEMTLICLFSLSALFAGPFSILLVPVLWVISAYFYGFSMLDYVCERRKMGIRDSIRFIRRHRYFVLGNGIMYSVLDTIPFIGLVIAPVNAVCGACTGIFEIEKNNDNGSSGQG